MPAETLVAAGALTVLAVLGVWKLGWLTPAGVASAVLVGCAVFAGAGWPGVGLLLFFFVSASALTGLRRMEKGGAGRSRRSAGQVLANGGVAAGLALLALAGWSTAAELGLAGALAAATADTWATEIGTAGRWPTRRLVGWEPVAPGATGGVSVPGSLAGAAGAASAGALAAFLFDGPAAGLLSAGFGGGVAGMLADSLIGATLEDEVGWVTNDVVNVAGTAIGAAVGWWLGSGVVA